MIACPRQLNWAKSFRRPRKADFCWGAAGAVIGAAIGIVTGTNVGEAVGKGAAIGAAAGLVSGGGQDFNEHYEDVQSKINEDLQ